MVGVLVRTSLQWVPQVSPTDVTGTQIYNMPNRSFQRSTTLSRGVPVSMRASSSHLVPHRSNRRLVLFSNKAYHPRSMARLLTLRSRGIFMTGSRTRIWRSFRRPGRLKRQLYTITKARLLGALWKIVRRLSAFSQSHMKSSYSLTTTFCRRI